MVTLVSIYFMSLAGNFSAIAIVSNISKKRTVDDKYYEIVKAWIVVSIVTGLLLLAKVSL